MVVRRRCGEALWVVALAARHHLPAVYAYRYFTARGGLMSYGVEVSDLFRRALKAIGLEIAATLLASADEVIE